MEELGGGGRDPPLSHPSMHPAGGRGSRFGGEGTAGLGVCGEPSPAPVGGQALARRNSAFWTRRASRVVVPAAGAGATRGPSVRCSPEGSSARTGRGVGWGALLPPPHPYPCPRTQGQHP